MRRDADHDAAERFVEHGALTHPGRHAERIAALPDAPAALFDIVQGLLIHDAARERLHGELPPHGRDDPRATLAVPVRIDDVLRLSSDPLDRPRPPALRSVGTCRDMALLLCGLLRCKGVPARVRCGFATYLDPGRHEDHWLCEARPPGAARWVALDAQMDAAHAAHLGIDFDPRDVPAERFMTADAAWRALRAGADPASFGHGATRGIWFVAVNLERDRLAREKMEISPWDAWRDVPAPARHLTPERLRACDALAGV